MSQPRSLVPPEGNPYRSIYLLLLFAFCSMLIGFPLLMYISGLGAGSVIFIALLIVAVAVLILWLTLWMARTVERDRIDLRSADAWARWHFSEEEFRTFICSERKRTWFWALFYATGGFALGILFLSTLEDTITGGLLIGGSLLAAIMMLTLGGPPWRASEYAREVVIGPRGVQVLGRYLPIELPIIRLKSVYLRGEDPAVLSFVLRSGRRIEEIRVPVARGYREEAEALVGRFEDRMARAQQ